MILKYSKPKGVPYIEFEDGCKLIFCTPLEDKQRGFKWLSFSGKIESEFKIGGKGKKKGKSFISTEHVGFMTDMKLTEIPQDVKGKDGPLSLVTLAQLKKIFKELAPDGYFPRENLEILADKLDNKFNHVDLDELMDDPDLIDEDVVRR